MTQEAHVGERAATCTSPQSDRQTSLRSMHNAPTFRLLIKVAVKGARQCDFDIFAESHGLQRVIALFGGRFSGGWQELVDRSLAPPVHVPILL